MFLKVDPKSGIPIYIQIIDQIKSQIASGRLKVGDRIPTVRELAIELQINPNTVAKSYRELERQELLKARPGQGSYISSGDTGLQFAHRKSIVERMMEQPIVQAYHLQLTRTQTSDIFMTKLEEIYGQINNNQESEEINNE